MDTYPQVTIFKLGGKGVCQFTEARAWAGKNTPVRTIQASLQAANAVSVQHLN